MNNKGLGRRALIRLSVAAASSHVFHVWSACSDDADEGSTGAVAGDGGNTAVGGGVEASCIVSPQEIQGPYYFDPRLVRSEIAEGVPGTSLIVCLRVVDANANCAPIAGVAVDLWHADSAGIYSGYADQAVDTTGETFLRGTQITGSDGRVEFATVFPGWYPTRAPHAHFKLRLRNASEVTSRSTFRRKSVATCTCRNLMQCAAKLSFAMPATPSRTRPAARICRRCSPT